MSAHASSSSTSSKKRHSNGAVTVTESDHKNKKSKHVSGSQAVFSWSEASGSVEDNSQRVESILIDSPSFTPPKTMSLYHSKSSAARKESTTATSDSLVVGHRPSHAPNVVIESNNWDIATAASEAEATRAKGYPGSYLVAVYDPATGKATLHPAPLLSVSRTIVPQAADGGDATSARIQSNFQTARRDLGELFGNRKQKIAMRNADRMKVDTTGMDENILQGITDSVHGSKVESKSAQSKQAKNEDGSDATSSSQPSAADLASRPIPTPHLDVSSPEFVYPLSELLPLSVATNINPSAMMHAGDADHVKKLLPGPTFKSTWLQSRIWSRVLASRRAAGEAPAGILKTSSSPQKAQIKQLLYIAYLWSLRVLASASRSRILSDRKALKEKLKLQGRDGEADPSAEALLDQILSANCERERGNNRLHLTPFLETKLLATICALCLHIDGYQLDPEALASEMGMPRQKILEVLKSLGCTSRYRQVVDPALGVSEDGKASGGAKGRKVMVLKLPVKLPDGRSGQPPKR